jgi:hypothetical protein
LSHDTQIQAPLAALGTGFGQSTLQFSASVEVTEERLASSSQVHNRRITVEREVAGALDAQIQQLASVAFTAWKHDDLVAAGTPFVARRVLPARPFDEVLVDGTHHYNFAKCVVQSMRQKKLKLAGEIVDDFTGFDPARPDSVESFGVPSSSGTVGARPLGD